MAAQAIRSLAPVGLACSNAVPQGPPSGLQGVLARGVLAAEEDGS